MKRLRGQDRRDGPLSRSLADSTDPGADAARARVADLLESMTHVTLQVVVVSPPDATRLAAVDRARDAALLGGRDVLLRDAVAAARDATMRSFALGGFSGTWAATDMAVSVVRADDRVAAAAALEEAMIAAVVEDLVDADTLAVLRSTWEELTSLRSIPAPGSLSGLTVPAAAAARGPIQIAIVAALVVVIVVCYLAFGGVPGVAIALLAIALVAVVSRRWWQPEL